jgi:hypothetical protein
VNHGQMQTPAPASLRQKSNSAWRKRWARLVRMSRQELVARAQQGFLKRWDSAPFQHYRSSSHFQPDVSALANDSARFFFSSAEIPHLVKLTRNLLPDQALRITDRADRICRHQFDLLGYENLEYGPVIDWHLDAVSGKRAPRKSWFKIPYLNFNEVGDHKVIWELNRHQHLVTLAKAYCFTGNEHYVHELCAQWYHWNKENPYSIGINWASSLEVAFRTLSWLWVRQLLANCSVLPTHFQSELLEALARNGRHISRNLSTYFSPNTHLLGEAVALFFLGTLCPQIPSASHWRKLGWEIILAEAGRQIREDGMHFELSLYYHVYALDLFLHSRILANRNGQTIPGSLDRTIEKMSEVLCGLGQAGAPPRIGDDDGGRVFDPTRNCATHMLDPLSTAAVLFRRADFKAGSQGLCEETLWLLGADGAARFVELPATRPIVTSRAFESSGIYVLASATPRTQLVARAGPMGALRAGHSHCDSLSLHLSIDGREFLADPGTFQYVSDAGVRDEFRGTAAHNTLRIDGLDQAVAGDTFSWNSPPAVRVEHWIQGQTFDLLAASHSGYQRLTAPILHRRWIFHLKSRFWFVLDVVEGDGRHLLEVFWHLAPGCVWQTKAGNAVLAVTAAGDEGALTVLSPEGRDWSRAVRQGWYSPAYGRKTESSVLNFRKESGLPANFATMLFPGEELSARLVAMESACREDLRSNVIGYRCEDSGETHFFFFGVPGRRWTCQGWASDAAFLYCRVNSRSELVHSILCDGSFVEIDGSRVLAALRRVKRIEWVGATELSRAWCSDEEAIHPQGQRSLLFPELTIAARTRENPREGNN